MQRHKLTLELPQGAPPREFRIFSFGQVETTKGVFLFDSEAAASVLKRWQEYGNRLSIDYEHQALEPGSSVARGARVSIFQPGVLHRQRRPDCGADQSGAHQHTGH